MCNPLAISRNINCRRVGCGSTASSHEGRILNTNVQWALVVDACNLSKRVTSLTSISLGYRSTLQPPTRTLQGCLQFSNNWVRRWTMPKPKRTSMQGSTVDRRSPSLWQKLTEAMAPPWLNWPLSLGKHQEAGGCEPASLHQGCQHRTISQGPLWEIFKRYNYRNVSLPNPME